MLRCIPNGDSLLVAGGKDSSIRETTSIDSSPLVVIVLVVVVVGIDRPPPLVLPTVSLLRTLSTVSTASFAFFPSPFSVPRNKLDADDSIEIERCLSLAIPISHRATR